MSDRSPNPQAGDVVLGGNLSLPRAIAPDSLVLGGWEGVLEGLASRSEEARIAALSLALNHGEMGVELVIKALQDESPIVHRQAFRLLYGYNARHISLAVRAVLQQYNPYCYFQRRYTLVDSEETESDEILALAIAPDNQTLLSGGAGGVVKVWNLLSGELVRCLPGRSRAIQGLAIARNGQVAIAGGHDSSLRVWDLPSGDILHVLSSSPHKIFSVAIEHDGKFAVSGSHKTIRVWHLRQSREARVLSGHASSVYALCLEEDGSVLLSVGAEGTLCRWDLRSGENLQTLRLDMSEASSMVFDKDGRAIACGGAWNGRLEIRDTQTGMLRHGFVQPDPRDRGACTTAVAFAPDCRVVFGAAGDGVQSRYGCGYAIDIWDLASGEAIAQLEGHSGIVRSLAVSSNGELLVSGDEAGRIAVWGVV